jgi:hypothetical protein
LAIVTYLIEDLLATLLLPLPSVMELTDIVG